MKQLRVSLAVIVLAFVFAQMASADYWFVTTNGTGEGTSWADATNSIQGAIGASSAGDTIWVSNGVYDAGGELVYEGVSNRVSINKAITVRSANNDPTNTIIKGAGPKGLSAIRCVYMVAGSSLIGFTLTNGATLTTGYGGGVYCGTTSIISNCVITANSADRGGGAFQGKLYNCTIIGNSAGGSGGGVYFQATLYDCMLTNNSASLGGGVYDCTLVRCTLTGNYGSSQGGGATVATLYNCMLTGNSAGGSGGGGAINSTLYNCALIGNWVTGSGAGARLGTLYNCTIVGNSAASSGGGVYQATLLYNCISWCNNKVDSDNTWYYSCARGITGDGTITNDPLFIADGSGYGASHVAGNYRLSDHSPCINTGTNFSWMTTPGVRSNDVDGSPRIDNLSGQVDMGCYEHLQLGYTIFSAY